MLVLLKHFDPRYAPARNSRKAHLLSFVQLVFIATWKFHINTLYKLIISFQKNFILN